MFRWYRDAAVCYAFLSDYQGGPRLRSRWFTRGWTLQELIAPVDLEFYDATWKFCGHRVDLSAEVARVTGIDERVLKRHGMRARLGSSSGAGSVLPLSFSTRGIDRILLRYGVSAKMSWAAKRETTRGEDIAYCLLGIFDVNMPLLYGEGGTKAFRRLQEEIARRSQDHTLLTWEANSSYGEPTLFADNPSMFKDGHLYRPVRSLRGTPISFSNGGVELDVHLAPYTSTMTSRRSTAKLPFGEPIWLAILNCTTKDHFTSPALLLRKTPRLASSFTYHIFWLQLTGGYRHVSVSSGQSFVHLQFRRGWGSGGGKWSFHQILGRDHAPADVMGTNKARIDFDPSALTRTRITFHEFDVSNTLEATPLALISVQSIQGYLVRSTAERDGCATEVSRGLLPREWIRDGATNNTICGVATVSKPAERDTFLIVWGVRYPREEVGRPVPEDADGWPSKHAMPFCKIYLVDFGLLVLRYRDEQETTPLTLWEIDCITRALDGLSTRGRVHPPGFLMTAEPLDCSTQEISSSKEVLQQTDGEAVCLEANIKMERFLDRARFQISLSMRQVASRELGSTGARVNTV